MLRSMNWLVPPLVSRWDENDNNKSGLLILPINLVSIERLEVQSDRVMLIASGPILNLY